MVDIPGEVLYSSGMEAINTYKLGRGQATHIKPTNGMQAVCGATGAFHAEGIVPLADATCKRCILAQAIDGKHARN